MTKPTGFILYEGPSILDGQPIVAIATLKTANRKTGDMIQTWILRSDLSPTDALKQAKDGSVCGSCPHRQSIGGACYVNVGQAPSAVYRSYKSGKYQHLDAISKSHFVGRMVRLGAYGDPAAVPASIWSQIVGWSEGHTGYTHQIGHKNFDLAILDLCMVSADTPKAAAMHQKFKRRTFRVKTPDSELLPNEIECVSDTMGMSCADCGLCNGARQSNVSIAINVHGTLSSRYENKYGKVNIIPTVAA